MTLPVGQFFFSSRRLHTISDRDWSSDVCSSDLCPTDRFQPFFESGLLDIALFDINQSDQLDLQLSGRTINAGSLHRPLLVIANYVFDSIPQELFYINERQCHQCLVSLLVDEDPQTLTAAELLERAQGNYDY